MAGEKIVLAAVAHLLGLLDHGAARRNNFLRRAKAILQLDISRKLMSPSTAIIILNWNGIEDTLICLDSLRDLMYTNFQVIVVDNGSADDSLPRLRAYNAPYPYTLLENGANLGFAEGNNVGLSHALRSGAEYLMLLNNDTTIAPNCIDRLVEAANSYPEAGVFSARVFFMDRPDKVWSSEIRWDRSRLRFNFIGQGEDENALPSELHETDTVIGAALFFRAAVAKSIGLLDSRFFLVHEESDWCFKARRHGFKCLVAPQAKVWHKVGSSFGGEESPLFSYFGTRNIFLWLENNRGKGELLRMIWQTLRGDLPKIKLDRDSQAPFLKRLIWAIKEAPGNWATSFHNPVSRACRLGFRDYVLRRFGDCPADVRAISKAWSLNQHSR
jgi:GT2 family glycosyltransferase